MHSHVKLLPECFGETVLLGKSHANTETHVLCAVWGIKTRELTGLMHSFQRNICVHTTVSEIFHIKMR
jgi:hypothetical protein